MGKREQGTADHAVAGNPDAGEWLSIPEAIGWILFRDLKEARKCSAESPARMSLTYGFAKAGVEGPTPVISLKDAEGALLAALKQGLVKAEGQQDGARSMIPPLVWALVKSFSRNSPWGAVNGDGATLLSQILVSADMLVKAFPEAPEPVGEGQGGDAVVPNAVAVSDAAPARLEPLTPKPGKRGRKVVYNWPPFYAEARRFFEESGGSLIQADVERHMTAWCGEKFSEGEIRKHVKAALAGNQAPTPGK